MFSCLLLECNGRNGNIKKNSNNYYTRLATTLVLSFLIGQYWFVHNLMRAVR